MPNPTLDGGLQAVRSNLIRYTPAVHALEDGSPQYPEPVHVLWMSVLMDDSLGDTLIIAPPDHAKTQVCGVNFPAWFIGQDGNRRVLYISSTASLAEKQSMAVRETIEFNTRYKALFPEIEPDKVRGWRNTTWHVKRKNVGLKDATFHAAGVGGDVIGRRADLLILDDVNDEENTQTDYQRQKVNTWIAKTAKSRVVPTGRTVCIMTRWHEEDLAQWCRKAGFTIVHVPALSDGPEVYATIKRYNHETRKDDLIARMLVHSDGPALWPGRWSATQLRRRRLEVGVEVFAQMYQGLPVPAGGAIFKEEWWRYYTALPQSFSVIVQTADTAFQDKQTSDFSVILTWGLGIDGRIYLLDMWRDRVQFPELKRQFELQYKKWRPSRVIVEERASGQAIIQEFRQARDGTPAIPVVAFKDKNIDKVMRAHSVTGYFEGGLVMIPRDDRADWVFDFRSEMQMFPAGAHDDIVDAAVIGVGQLANYLSPRLPDEFFDPQDTYIGDVFSRSF